MGKYKIKPRLETTPEDRYRKSKLDYLFYIANELAEANRLKRLEISTNMKRWATEDYISKIVKDLEDKA